MSSMMDRAMEERLEREQAEAVASALGISTSDLQDLEWTLQDHASDDGLLYGRNVYFGENSDPEILAKIDGLVDGKWVRIGPL